MIVTEEAQNKIAYLIKESQIATPEWVQFLRISVSPGGCSGLRHTLFFDYEIKNDDVVYTFNNFDIRIDSMSNPYLEGATLDYVEKIDKIGFILDNPNANGTCSCGGSFH